MVERHADHRDQLAHRSIEHLPLFYIIHLSLFAAVVSRSSVLQILREIDDKILHVGHDPVRTQASPVGQLVDRKLGDIHTVEVDLAYRPVRQKSILITYNIF